MPTRDAESALRGMPLFADVPDDEIADLAPRCRMRRFERGETIFHEGDAANTLPVVASGRVKVVRYGSSGRQVLLEQFGPGESFGEVAIFDHQPYPATAIAMENDTGLVEIPRREFTELLKRHPEVAIKTIGRLAGLLRETTRRLRDVAAERVEERIAHLLLALDRRLGRPGTDGRRIPVVFTRQEIAAMVGTTTETAIRILSRWEKNEILSSDRHGLLIRDVATLRDIAAEPLEEE